MFRRNNTYQLSNPLKLRQRYLHIPLHYRNINTNASQLHAYHVTNNKTLSNIVDNNKGNDNFENILPSSEKNNDDDNVNPDDNNNENEGDNNEGDNGNNVKIDDHYDDNNNYYNEDNDNYYIENNDCSYRDDNEDNDNYYNEDDNNNYYEEDDGNRDDGDEQHNCTEQIVNEAMDSSKLPNGSSEFLPYFNNMTEFLLFCWIQKHNICKNVSVLFCLTIRYLTFIIIISFFFSD
jgi:hypothetical protein